MSESRMNPTESSRRDFLKGATAASVAAIGAHSPSAGATEKVSPARAPAPLQTQKNKKFIAIQVGAVSFVDEGVDKVLDIFQERARVNALMLAVFTYGRGIAGRQVPGQPLPDHGAQEYDTKAFNGGSYAALHPEYYDKTIFTNLRAPDLGEFDLLATV